MTTLNASVLPLLAALCAPVLAHADEAQATAQAPASEAQASISASSEDSATLEAYLNKRSSEHRLDIGGSLGLNNAGGFGAVPGFGLVADVRLFKGLSLGAGVGGGLGGIRLTAHSRLYPLGVANGLFLQGSVAANSGRSIRFEDGAQPVDVELLQATTANAALGYRFDMGRRGWIVLEAGWAFRLDERGYRTSGTRELTDVEQSVVRFSQAGGLLLGLSGGFSVL